MNTKVIREIVINGLFLALIVIFAYVPYLGIITIGTLSFTTIHIIVLIAASLFGVKTGTLVGLYFGIFSFLKAFQYPGQFDYFFINPFISILPRVLFGFISGYIFDLLKKKLTNKQFKIALVPVAAILTFIHTLLVLLCLYIFGIEDIFRISYATGLESLVGDYSGYGSFFYFVIAFVSIGSSVEIIGAAIITPICFAALEGVIQSYNLGKKEEVKEEISQKEEIKTTEKYWLFKI